ncbi:DUF6119 family protein [Trichococcus flocculiformis]|uniref:DUF6119 family protein n=1 Tax=Trichococcus flocculiformis TaxID=82803 RepID=UPI003DA383CE
MSNVNLYKISNDKKIEFFEKILEKMGEPILKEVIREGVNYSVKLYFNNHLVEKQVTWSWLLTEFRQENLSTSSNPSATVVIDIQNEIYVFTFGNSFFLADKYCDDTFAFAFARKIQFQNVKTTALLSPNSRRNKVVNTYISNDQLEFDSGESFAKIKARMVIDEDFELYKESIEIGKSLKFNLENDSLLSLVNLIIHIENIMESVTTDFYKIPLFKKVTDENILSELEQHLQLMISEESPSIQISEMEIIGVNEIFNNNDLQFELKYRRSRIQVTELSMLEIRNFMLEHQLNLDDTFFKIKIISYRGGVPVRTDSLKVLIDYVDDEHRCVLSRGVWYHFNEDYLEYLRDSIYEIESHYNEDYDFSRAHLEEYREQKFIVEKNNPEYEGMPENEIKKKIDHKYYTERVYNNYLEENFGFENYDRNIQRVGTQNIEAMDLYKDETMFAVKIGNASSKLSYVIDQSIVSLKLYKNNIINIPNIKKVGIWLILERQHRLTIREDSTPEINELDMLMLKNRIDEWKKIVRLAGFTPVININYMS